MDGIRKLRDVFGWFWGVMAYQVNYAEYYWDEDIEYALWMDWYWGQQNAERSNFLSPWNLYGDF